ncbi:MAG TPA: HlyD family efflux transporter periplasmic adaptor subunit [Thermoanaerobaculia bacterium]|nr:HlyD family efflux transporter periplasmic adaptor subunit [Thermoanaerobaculia bacterium]
MTFRARLSTLLLAAILASGCGGSATDPKKEQSSAPGPATPVRVAPVEKATLAEIVSAPGKITAMSQEKVRAPFAGTLVEFTVTDGDRVRRGQIVGSVVARDSEAALAGAREMEREAKSDAERRDAARAVELARRNLVRAPLAVASDGIVVSHAASAGDRVSEDEEILSIAETKSLVVLADVPQAQLPKIRAGEAVQIEIPGRPPAGGRVHGILAESGPSDLTAPVRIDLDAAPGMAVGLFATARITVAERRDVPSVPDAAVVRDDVTGASRVAVAGADGKAHWIAVTPGIAQNGRTEIAAPPLDPAIRVIVSGQAGLPEGTPVAPSR